MKRARSLLLIAAFVGPVACSSNPATDLTRGISDMISGLDGWLGAGNVPSAHLAKLRGVHEPETWRLRADVRGAMDTARGALRSLGASDFSTWRDAGIVTQVVSSCATDHDASLMRAEAVDTLARMAPWTFQAEVPPEFEVREEDVIDALKIVRNAHGRTDDDPAFTAEVLGAVRLLGAYRFDGTDPLGPAVPLVVASRRDQGAVRNARGVLIAFTGSALEGFQADSEIRDAMDRAYVALGATVIRASLRSALTGDASSVVRAAAAAHIGRLRVTGAEPELARSLRQDVSSSVRRAAASALGNYPPDAVVPALIEGLYDDMPDVRGAVSRALAASTGEAFGTDRGAWKRWWAERSGGTGSAVIGGGADE